MGVTKWPIQACTIPVQLMLSKQMLAQLWHPVVPSEALDLLHRAMCSVLYCRNALAIGTASKVGVCFHHCVFACCPGGCQGNTERVVAKRRLPGGHLVCPLICCIGRCRVHCFHTSIWPYKWPVTEAHLLVAAHFCLL
jgi:hypothetical protein